MRTFPGARAAPFLPIAPAIGITLILAGPVWADPPAAVPLPDRAPAREISRQSPRQPSFAEMQLRLDRSDRLAALHALQMALNQVGDGGTFVWKKNNRRLQGVIRPTNAFRNAHGQICRHVIYALSLGQFRKQIEIVACREAGGRWRL